jgi:hypothetical protein
MAAIGSKMRKLSWSGHSGGSRDSSARPEYFEAAHALVWSGWLSKTGSKDKAFTAARRFFKLRADGLFEYYKSAKHTEPAGAVDLKEATSIQPSRVAGRAGFDIHTPSRIWHIQDSEGQPERLTAIILQLQQTVIMLHQRADMEAGNVEDPGHVELMTSASNIAVDPTDCFACAVFQ